MCNGQCKQLGICATSHRMIPPRTFAKYKKPRITQAHWCRAYVGPVPLQAPCDWPPRDTAICDSALQCADQLQLLPEPEVLTWTLGFLTLFHSWLYPIPFFTLPYSTLILFCVMLTDWCVTSTMNDKYWVKCVQHSTSSVYPSLVLMWVIQMFCCDPSLAV